MTMQDIPGPMTMIRIDGARIKQLREQKGFTQLYLATAVEVTTDTISRWENRRYPTIKKENGLKLAETLGVALEELLELVDEEEADQGEAAVTDSGLSSGFPSEASKIENQDHGQFKKKNDSGLKGKLGWAAFGVLCVTLAVCFVLWWKSGKENPLPVSIIRHLPEQYIPGQPFPVLLEVRGQRRQNIALIIREKVPVTARVIKTFPEVAGKGGQLTQLQWLANVRGSKFFGYLLVTDRTNRTGAGDLSFAGNYAIRLERSSDNTSMAENKNSVEEIDIAGDVKIAAGRYHWADSDQDNRISDQEILKVYDNYKELSGLDVGIADIEAIWLSSGYRLDNDGKAVTSIQ